MFSVTSRKTSHNVPKQNHKSNPLNNHIGEHYAIDYDSIVGMQSC